MKEPFTAHVLTQWKAPFTGGYERVLPVGFEFCVLFDPPENATAASADAISPERWAPILIAEADLKSPKFDGWYVVINFGLLAAHCKLQPWWHVVWLWMQGKLPRTYRVLRQPKRR